MANLADDDRVGTRIADRYRLDQVIGKGGMGVVYRGIHLWTERPVAVKLLATDEGENASKRFLREARAAASVRHPNLVEVLDVGEAEDGLMYQVLELLEGESLLSHLQRKDRMRSEDVLDVLVPVLDALAALHKANVIHRDIKPGNIFLSTDGSGRVVPKLLDLGISKPLDAEEALTMTGSLMGTPSYMSPEQARGEANIGFGADIWAMGVVLYQCLSGERPFASESIPGLLHKIATDRPSPIALRCPNLPAKLAEAVDTALAYDASERHKTATEFADALVNAALSAGWPLTCRIPSGPNISLTPVPAMPSDTLDPDATPISRDPDATPISRDPDATPISRDPDATPISREADATPVSHDPDATPISSEPIATPPAPVVGVPAAAPKVSRTARTLAGSGPTPATREAKRKAAAEPTPAGHAVGDPQPTEGASLQVKSRTGWMTPAGEAARATEDPVEADGPEAASESMQLPMRRSWAGLIGLAVLLVTAGAVGWLVTASQAEPDAEEPAAPIASPPEADPTEGAPETPPTGNPLPAGAITVNSDPSPDAGPGETEAPPAEHVEATTEPRRPPSTAVRRPPRRPPRPSPETEPSGEVERGANNAFILE